MHADAPSHESRRPWVDRDSLTIAVIYTAAWCLMLVNSGRYWDDWAYFDLAFPAAAAWAKESGQFWQHYFEAFLSWLPGTELVTHALVFLLYLACALLLNRLLRRVPGLDRFGQVMTAILFAVFPANAARIAMIDFSYAVSLAVFLLAWYLIVVDLERPRSWIPPLAMVLFFFAMLTTGSLMTFVVIVPPYIWLVHADRLADPSERGRIIGRYGGILVLPIAAWLLRSIALKPSGWYETYNTVTSFKLGWAFRVLPLALRSSVWTPIKDALSVGWIPTLILALPTYLLLRHIPTGGFEEHRTRIRFDLSTLAVGLLTLFLGLYPYLAVGKFPQAFDWQTRHQLLVPFGAGITMYALVILVVDTLRLRGELAHAVVVGSLALLTASFVVADVRICLDYQADWYKQIALMDFMRSSPEFRDGNYFVVRNEAHELDTEERQVYFPFELNGMMQRVFGDTRRFGVATETENDFLDWLRIGYSTKPQYNAVQYQPYPARPYVVLITPGTLDVTKPSVLLGMMWRQYFAPDEFEKQVRDIVNVTVKRR